MLIYCGKNNEKSCGTVKARIFKVLQDFFLFTPDLVLCLGRHLGVVAVLVWGKKCLPRVRSRLR